MALSAVAQLIDGSQLQLQARHYPSDEDLKGPGLGHVTSSVQTQSAREEPLMTYTAKDRTFAENAPIHGMNERGFAQVVGDALQAHYGPLKSAAKRCANDAGASVQSAKNWLGGMCAPSAIYLKRLECKVPGLAAEMRRLQAMQSELNPDYQRDLSAFIQLLQSIEHT